MIAPAAIVAAVLVIAGGSAWRPHAPLPVPRTEVAAASFRGGIAVVGGYLANGDSTSRVDLYRPASDSWVGLPDLPVAVHHAMAASAGGNLYVVGGYGHDARRLRSAFTFEGDRWRGLRPMPAARAAGGAAVVGGKLYVIGGVGPRSLARVAFVLDLESGSWTEMPGPSPREHLAVAAARGKVFALAGRHAGFDSNVRTFESYSPASRRWTRLASVPEARGGTGAAAAGRLLVSVGGEEPAGTIRSVYGYDLERRRWRRLPDLPTPRHGLGVAALGGRVYAVGGGTSPGLTVSGANESLLP